MTKKIDYMPALISLEDAVRALRDIVGLDPERPTVSNPEKVARRALERISKQSGTDVTFEGHTPRPNERMFDKVLAIDVPAPGQHPNVGHIVAQSPTRVRPVGAPFYDGPIGVEIGDLPA